MYDGSGDKGHPVVQEPTRKTRYDHSHASRSKDPTYHHDDVSFFSGDSQVHRREENSRPRAMVWHTEYCSDAKEDYTKPYRPSEFAENSKFVPRIATAPFPINVKIPTNLGKYNGMSDPSDHLLRFVVVGGISGWTLLCWCHMFTLTLTRASREWFEKLPNGLIKSWEVLVAKFSQHFS